MQSEKIRNALQNKGFLTPWEIGFINSLVKEHWDYILIPSQIIALNNIHHKIVKKIYS